jgi:ParB family transcriptional regulator, chromosome partitioning protein
MGISESSYQKRSKIGLLHPIGVTTESVLVYGLHRLRAAESLGWEEIEAKILQGDELDAQLAEIDENLRNNSLSVIEQSEHVARREHIMHARGDRAKRGGDGSNQYMSKGVTVTPLLPKTTEELAAQMGMSKSSYQKRSKIGRGLTEEAVTVVTLYPPMLRNHSCNLLLQ